MIVLNTNEYYIEPISIHANYKSELGAPHAMYKRSWLNLPTETNDDLLVSFDETWNEDKDFPLISRKFAFYLFFNFLLRLIAYS